MAEELSQRCLRLSLECEEDDIIDLGEKDQPKADGKMELSVVGRIMTERTVNFDAFKRTMTQVWALSRSVIFRAIENNLFIIQFFHWRDKEKVLDGRPWSFDHQLVTLKEINGDEQPSQVDLRFCPFWVRIYDLPFGSRATNDVHKIAERIGQVMEVEDDVIGWDRARRVRVMLDIHKPLRRFQKLRDNNDNVVKVEFKYERLPNYCYVCGLIGHIERDCKLNDEGNGDRQWGPWLRASPRKGRQKIQEEVQDFVNGRRVLHFQTKPKANNREENEKPCSSRSCSSSTMGGQKGANGDTVAESVCDSRAAAKTPPMIPCVNTNNTGTVFNQSQQLLGAEVGSKERLEDSTISKVDDQPTPAMRESQRASVIGASDKKTTKKTWKRRQQPDNMENKEVENVGRRVSMGTKRGLKEVVDGLDVDVEMEDVRKRMCIMESSPIAPITESVAAVGIPRPREEQ